MSTLDWSVATHVSRLLPHLLLRVVLGAELLPLVLQATSPVGQVLLQHSGQWKAVVAAFRKYIPKYSPGGGCMYLSVALVEGVCPGLQACIRRGPGPGQAARAHPAHACRAGGGLASRHRAGHSAGHEARPAGGQGSEAGSLKSKHLIEPTCLGCWSLGQCQSTCQSSSGSKMRTCPQPPGAQLSRRRYYLSLLSSSEFTE